jgi:Na+/phosphate symporter
MTFGGSPHSAEKVQHDINSILDAIAQMLAKVRLQQLAEEEKEAQQEPLPRKAELESHPLEVAEIERFDEPPC